MLDFPVVGAWKPGQVTTSFVASSRRVLPELEMLIEQAWDRAMSRPGVHLFDGPMCRLESRDVSRDRIHLTLSRTSYKPFVGTNMNRSADGFGREFLANPVGLSAVLLSADGQLLMGRRNANVAYYPSRVHPFAGCLEPAESLDVFADVRRELREELALTEPDIIEMFCTGITEDRSLRQPEMTFAVRTHKTLAQIESQLDAQEHRGIFHTPATAEGIEQALRSKEAFTPVGIGAMLLFGRSAFGGAWFEQNSQAFR
ncbi:MAG TPA: NUDIX domain-containing protein [Bryobacteraceae bacterium]|nr:NUDIX domain-containing protein [Bryobacteraceae bacterium]